MFGLLMVVSVKRCVLFIVEENDRFDAAFQ